MAKHRLEELGSREVLALAIAVEHANASRLATLADMVEGHDPELPALFRELREAEIQHARILEAEWRRLFGDAPRPEIGEEDIEGVIEAVDLEHGEHAIFDDLGVEGVLRLVEQAERGALAFYRRAAAEATESELQALYLRLAAMEEAHAGTVAVRQRRVTSDDDRS